MRGEMLEIVEMSDAFDPYRKWLGIPPGEQPPHHYRLLGISPFEDDPDAIESGADQRMGHLRTFQTGVHSALSQKLLNEVVAAKLCLLSREKKAAYDAELRQRLEPPKKAADPVAPAATPMRAAAPARAIPVAAPTPMATPLSPATVLRSSPRRPKTKSPSAAIGWSAGGAALAVLAMIVFIASRGSTPTPGSPPAASGEAVAASGKAPPDANASLIAPVLEKHPSGAAAPAAQSPRAVSPNPKMEDEKAGGANDSKTPGTPSTANANSMASDGPAPPFAVAPFDGQQARAHQEAWAAFLKTSVEQKNSIGLPLVLLPPGEFAMGSTPEQIAEAKRLAQQSEGDSDKWSLGRIEAEAPAHRVTISRPFLVGATEVTVAQYRRFVDASGYVTETERFGGGDSVKKDEQDSQKKALTWRGLVTGNDAAAVHQITWNDAVAFCNWLSDAEKLSRCYRGSEQDGWQLELSGEGYRLPTEAEWEYACRAGTTTHYSFGDDPSAFAQYGWSLKNGPVSNPNAVARKLPNPFGLYDLHGNLAEWCHDWFPSDYRVETSADDPTGPPSGNTKVHRGGAFDSPIVRGRSAFRGNFLAIVRFHDLGFRVVRVSTADVADSNAGSKE